MAQPTAYDRQASFSNIQAQAPSDPLPGATVDSEFNAVKVTLDDIRTNLTLIQRDDGALANESVGLDQLSTEIEVGWQAPTVWLTATAYVSGDTVFHGSAFYRLLTAHTSGTFATDLAAAKWEEIVDLSDLTIVAASQIANTPAGSIAATTVQAAIDELASEKAASSHTHPSSAITDGTAAGRALFTAATAAAQRTALGLGLLALEDTVPVTDINAQLALSGIIEPTALGASVNDWAPTGVATCSTIRVSASATDVDLTGLLAPATDGEVKIIENVGTDYAVTLQPSSASSAAANRFLIPKPIVIGPNLSAALKYDLDGTTPRWRLFDRSGSFGRGHIFGLALSNNSSDATNDLDIAVGEARGERNLLDLVLTTALTKQLDAVWAAGTAAGGRYTTAITNTTYHVFLIGKADGTTDVFFYAAGTDPTSVLPTGYIDYRRIGSIIRLGGAIVLFFQNGDQFQRKAVVIDIVAANPGTSAVSRTLTVPIGIRVDAETYLSLQNDSTGVNSYALLSDLDLEDELPAIGVTQSTSVRSQAGGTFNAGVPVTVRTNTSGQIRSRLSASDLNVTLRITTRGWIDRRGRDI